MFIGIDLGTSAVKLILAKKDGTLVRSVSKPYESIVPHPSWSEQSPEEWLRATVQGLRELVTGFETEILGMSFSGQMHGLVMLDSKGAVLRNAILWNDQRTKEEVEYLNAEVGMENLLKRTGNVALTGLTAPKLLWVRRHEPELFKRIAKIMLPKDFLVYRLSEAFVSDVSDASGTLYFDPRSKTYSKEMLSVLGISQDQLPTVHESFEVVGTLGEPYQSILGLPPGVKIIVGGGDQAVGAIGAGIVKNGECSLSLGTSGVVFVASDKFVVDQTSHLQSYAHANGKYHIMGVMLNAAGAVKWWNEFIQKERDYGSFFEEVAKASPSTPLFFLPYLNGERSPINDPSAKGVLFGLQSHHEKRDISRAIVEGVTFALKDSFELIRHLGIEIHRVRIIGGGAKSDMWAQMIADVLNVDVAKINCEEGPAFGAAILAMVGLKAYSSPGKACEALVRETSVFLPNPDVTSIYSKKYEIFKLLYPQMRPLFPLI